MPKDKKSKLRATEPPVAEVAAAPRSRSRKRPLNEGGAVSKKPRGGEEVMPPMARENASPHTAAECSRSAHTRMGVSNVKTYVINTKFNVYP